MEPVYADDEWDQLNKRSLNNDSEKNIARKVLDLLKVYMESESGDFKIKPSLVWVFGYWLLSSILMNYINSYAYERIPMEYGPLPDISFNTLSYLFGIKSEVELPVEISTLVIVSLNIFVYLHALMDWKNNGTRKLRHLFAIHSFLFNLRAITIISTSLPVPYKHGPCREDHVEMENHFLAAIQYTFAMGFGELKQMPQCGDLIFSGHTTFMTIYMLHLFRHVIKGFLLKTLLFLWNSLGLVYIIISRNHYTIDVVLAIILSVLAHYLFYSLLHLSYITNEYGSSLVGRFLKWVDYGGFKDYQDLETDNSPEINSN